jgi:hypothetical protein
MADRLFVDDNGVVAAVPGSMSGLDRRKCVRGRTRQRGHWQEQRRHGKECELTMGTRPSSGLVPRPENSPAFQRWEWLSDWAPVASATKEGFFRPFGTGPFGIGSRGMNPSAIFCRLAHRPTSLFPSSSWALRAVRCRAVTNEERHWQRRPELKKAAVEGSRPAGTVEMHLQCLPPHLRRGNSY